MIPLAIIGSVIIGLALLFFANRKVKNCPYILVLNCRNETAESTVLDILQKETDCCIVKSKTINAAGSELTKDASTSFVNRISEIQDVDNATLVSYNGEYMA